MGVGARLAIAASRACAGLLLAAAATAAAQEPQVAHNAPPDTPRFLGPSDQGASERAQAPYVAHARKTYPAARARFYSGLPRDESFFVTTRLHDAKGRYEQVFVFVDRVSKGEVTGRVASKIALIDGVKQGDTRTFPEAEVVDWTITHPDGSEEGNVVGKFFDHFDPSGVDAERPERCGVVLHADKGASLQDLPSLRVASQGDVPFHLPPDAPVGASAVRCERSALLPTPADLRVLSAGYPVVIVHGERIATLELVDGRLRFNMLHGEMYPAEIDVIGAFLDDGQAAFEGPPR